jgi:hypothetical protein
MTRYIGGVLSNQNYRQFGLYRIREAEEKTFRTSLGSHLTQIDCLIVIFEMLMIANRKSKSL